MQNAIQSFPGDANAQATHAPTTQHRMKTHAAAVPLAPAATLAWYCLRAQPKHEHIAASYLRKFSALEVFAPRLRYQRSRLKGQAWTTEALFPGYLFARFDLAERWREVQYSHAVRGILRFGERYPVVPPTMIGQLRDLMGPEELAVVEPALEPGRTVVVAEGAFQGLRTVITRYLPAKERVRVLMNLMGREMEIELPASSVVPAETDHPFK